MQASKHKKRTSSSRLTRLPLAVAIYLAIGSTSFVSAQDDPQDPATTTPPATAPRDPAGAPELATVTVTAQKRTENLQKVPISLQVLGEVKLEQENVSSFTDFAKLLPSVSFNSAGGGVFPGPGFVQVYMRGVASGGDGNHSGSQPSVGMYLDEQPITTIQGALDVHIYDISRIEALAGPQGTLYGASSQAGTVRIITNKPDPTSKASGYAMEANAIDGGGMGYVAEGFINIPLTPAAAIRLVGWSEHKAGYVDNVFGTRTFPTAGVTIDNADLVEDNYNESDVLGARAALKIDLNDNWSITPTIMGQHQESRGSTGFDENIGDLELTHFNPESADDRWTQASLTVQGKIGNFDIVYALSHLKRDVDSESDYSDYGFWYDTLAGYYVTDDNGDYIDPSQYIQATDGYRKTSHELRISSPSEDRFRFVAGVFWQDQSHDIFQRYFVDNLAASSEVGGYADTIWLTAQERNDRDSAVFGELSFDVSDKLTLTGGMRWFKNKNSLRGFFGFGAGFSGSTGEAACFPTSGEPVDGAPCTNLDGKIDEQNHIGKFNATYHFDDNKMVYMTWSEGYRPGGINRRSFHSDGSVVPPYKSDYLTNYEFGWKTSWAQNRLTWNGAVFQEDWKDFQISFLGQNGLTEILNAPQAQIRGLETELNWAATYNLVISGGAAFYNAKLTSNYCKLDFNGNVQETCSAADLQAPSGARLPITARFKGNLTARYNFQLGSLDSYAQATLVHQGNRRSDVRTFENSLLGDLDSYNLVDLSFGFQKNTWALDFFLKNAFDERAELGKFAECATATCGNQPYTIVAQPRTFGIRFSQNF